MPKGSEATPDQVNAYVQARRVGVDMGEAARSVGLSAAWASRFDKSVAGKAALGAAFKQAPKGVLDDFGLFRSTYLGHVEKAWMSEAADTVRRLLATPEREFLVINVVPGSGKTAFVLDLFTWLIARDRRLRTLFGADTKVNAEKGTGLIQSYLETQVPVWSDPRLVAKGEAVQATRVLAHDFGAFKGDGIWQRNQFLVDFADGGGQSNKEATCTAFGTTGVMGNRFELVAWDDLVTEQVTRSAAQSEQLESDWDGGLGESRLEPRGHSLLLLVGQRIGPRDLYRYNLDKVRVEVVDGVEQTPKMYTHIVFPAHFEDLCVGVHDKASARSWPYGCLLDAERVPWTDCATKMRNSPRAYEIQWQQREGTKDGALIENAWIYGGADSEGVERPGCLNRKRVLNEVPEGWSSPLLSLVTIDPSPTQFWAVQSWLCSKALNARALMQFCDRKMPSNLLLDYDGERFSGVLEDMWHASVAYGHPITHVVVEINAAQRWFLDNRATKLWRKARNVAITAHTTTRNKNDPDLGLSILVEPIKSGHYDLPYADVVSRTSTATLAQQLTSNHERNDQQMAPLDVSTPLWTEQGWTTMGEVRVGERVVTPTGEYADVVAVTPVSTQESFAVRFNDGSEVVASADHRWWVREYRTSNLTADWHWATTAELRESHAALGPKGRVYVEPRPIIGGEDIALPVDPYTLGVWLGDGDSYQGTIYGHPADTPFVRDFIEEGGYKTTDQKRQTCFGIIGLTRGLKAVGVIGNKHVPDQFLRGSTAQRLALLQGLMDTDGSVMTQKGRVYFANTNKNLVDAVAFLARSMGHRVNIQYYPPMFSEGSGTVKPGYRLEYWRVVWSAHSATLNPFRMPRKADKVTANVRPSGVRNLCVAGVDPVGPREVRCITVDHPSHRFLAGPALVPTGNCWFMELWFHRLSTPSKLPLLPRASWQRRPRPGFA